MEEEVGHSILQTGLATTCSGERGHRMLVRIIGTEFCDSIPGPEEISRFASATMQVQ
jgi:hypothetical protein